MGSKSSGSPTVTQASTLTSGQQSLLNSLTSLLGTQLGSGVSSYSGQINPDANSLQTSLYDKLTSMLNGSDSSTNATTDAVKSLTKAWDPAEATADWKKAIEAPTLQTWNDTTLPGLKESFAAYDAMGSGGAAKTITDAASKMSTGLESNLASTLLTDKNNATKSLLESAGLLSDMQKNTFNEAESIGSDLYKISSSQGLEGYTKWLSEQGYSNPWLNYLSTALSTKGTENIVSQNYNTTGSLISALGSLGGAGISNAGTLSTLCCWIFIEANGGELNPIVRRYRDEHMTERNRRGYYRLAEKLVPLMRKSKFWHKAVEWCMVKPMTSYGKYFYGLGRIGALFAPVTAFWLGVYNLLGYGKVVRGNGEVI